MYFPEVQSSVGYLLVSMVVSAYKYYALVTYNNCKNAMSYLKCLVRNGTLN